MGIITARGTSGKPMMIESQIAEGLLENMEAQCRCRRAEGPVFGA